MNIKNRLRFRNDQYLFPRRSVGTRFNRLRFRDADFKNNRLKKWSVN
jgi:hypothetical protein